MTEHTKEPWRVEQDTTLVWSVRDPDCDTSRALGYPIAQARTTPSGLWTKRPTENEGLANARRIVAAVNSLSGIPTEALEAGIVGEMVEALRDTTASLTAAVSLLGRGRKTARLAAPSDKMFDLMLHDYEASLDRARSILSKLGGTNGK